MYEAINYNFYLTFKTNDTHLTIIPEYMTC